MKQIVVFFFLIFISLGAFAEAFKVEDIRLDGLQRVSASPVFAVMPVRSGDVVDQEDVRNIIRAVFSTGFFSNVQVARDGNYLIVILQERPAIKSVDIDGNKAIATEVLEDVLKDSGIAEGEILQRQTLQGLSREIEKQYIAQARYDAKVEAKVEELPNNLVSINLDIDEGSPSRIKHINIIGNTVFSDEELLDNFELTSTKWNSFFTGSDKYAREKLTGDLETLESYYLDRGYLDFKVVSSQISVSPNKKGIYITLNVAEGPVYEVGEVNFAGDPIVAEDSLRKVFLLSSGDTFSQRKMTDTSEFLTTILGNAGYTNAEVNPVTQRREEGDLVDITYFFNPGKRVYVRRIEFIGNTKTDDEVLRREMRQLEGASASNALIEQSKVRLDRLGFFKSVEVDTVDVPGSDDLVDVQYTVEEQSSGSITASIGYAQVSKLNVGVSVSEQNWLGTGSEVGFGVNTSRFQTLYSFNYRDPYFTPDGVSRGFGAFFRERKFNNIGAARFATDAYGVNMNFGYPLSEISRLGFDFGYQHQRVRTSAFTPQEIVSSPQPRVGATYILESEYLDVLAGNIQQTDVNQFTTTEDFNFPTLEPGFIDLYGDEYDTLVTNLTWRKITLNRGVLATRGTSQRLDLEIAVPGSDLEYFKLTYDAQTFIPMGKSLTLRLKTNLGYGDGYGKLDELPFFENYFAGGFGSVRGFERSTLGPKGSPSRNYYRPETNSPILFCDVGAFSVCPETGQLALTEPFPEGRELDSIGGNILIEASAEVLLPIPFIEDTRSMQLVFFVDAGNAFSSSCGSNQANCSNVDLSNLSSSYGLGFTWISGFGPLTFSIADTINENEFDETEFFQFSLGAGF